MVCLDIGNQSNPVSIMSTQLPFTIQAQSIYRTSLTGFCRQGLGQLVCLFLKRHCDIGAFATGRKKTFRRFLEAVFLCQQSAVLKRLTCLLGKTGMNLRGFAMAYRITEYGILVQGFALWMIIWEMQYNALAIEEINSLASS